MKRLRRPVDLAKFPELFQVLPASDMADFIGVHRTTIYRAIDEGTLAAVKVGRTWLVSRRSAEALFWRPGTRRKMRTRTTSLTA